MRPPKWRGDKESVLLEGELGGSVKQHKSATALDYCFPSAQLGDTTRSGGPHTGRGSWTQIPTLNDLYTEDFSFPPLSPSTPPLLPCLHVSADILDSCGLTCNSLWTPGHCLFVTYC